MTVHDVTNLRLEFETTPTGLPNLAKNPSGLKGAWGYVTPVANTVMTSNGSSLAFYTTAAQACNFTTEFLPLAAGKYVAARFDFIDVPNGPANLRCTFDFYDTNKALISSSAQTGALSSPASNYVPTALAPAGTTYVKLRWNMYASTGTANPTANLSATINKVMVTWASTSGAIASVRTNLVTNPSFETNVTAWSSTGTTITRDTTQAAVGTASARLNCFSTAAVAFTDAFAVTGGKDYSAQFKTRAGSASTPASVQAVIRFYDASSNLIASAAAVATNNSTSGWTTHTCAGVTASSNATFARVFVMVNGRSGDIHYLDAVLLEQAGSAGAYFDGSSSATGKTYTWNGTANLSSSVETTAASYAFIDPITWRNILGPTHEITIDREALDVGTLTANVIDALLDPAVSSDLAPGKTVRCTALVGTVWESLFEGRIDNADVSYLRQDNGKLKTSITLSATDNIAVLANQLESRGIGTVAGLPYILEGKGVPWNCNGSGNQVASAAVVSNNENASVLDQISLTRDSVSGYAWVDRYNVMKAYDDASMLTAVACYFSDVTSAAADHDSYSAIDAGYNTEDVINQVLVNWLRTNPVTGESTEIPYGPYSDAPSISTYGPKQKTFTMHGATESPTAIAAFAAAVLASNKTPVRRASSVTLPVKDVRAMGHAAQLDLYSLVNVVFSTVISSSYRITSIKHSITTDKWLVDYGFSVDGAVAAPGDVPAPGVADVTDGTWILVGGSGAPAFANAWVNYGGTGTPVAAFMRKSGVIYLKGRIKTGTMSTAVFVLPAGYRPADYRLFVTHVQTVTSGAASAGTAHTHPLTNIGGLVQINTDGTVIPLTGTNASIGLDGISFPAEA